MSVEGAIHAVIQNLADAWNHQDPSAFGRVFSEDADYVTSGALRLHGRRTICGELVFASASPVGRVSLVADSLRLLRPDVAVVLCRWRMGGDDGEDGSRPLARTGLLTLVLQSVGDEWQVVLLHNTDRPAPAPGAA